MKRSSRERKRRARARRQDRIRARENPEVRRIITTLEGHMSGPVFIGSAAANAVRAINGGVLPRGLVEVKL